MPKTDLLLTSDVAQILGCHVRTVHRMVESGALAPAVRLPGLRGALLFHRDDVERIAKERAA